MASDDVIEYNPLEICRNVTGISTFALIILNQPMDHHRDIMLSLWKRSCYKVMCDGGANRFHAFIKKLNLNPSDYIPDLINGDFDSIYKDILEFYKDKCKVVNTPDQDYTDFTKSFNLAFNEMEERKIKMDFMITITNTTGRFDHILGNIQTLYEAREKTNIPVYLFGERSITWLLSKGKHRIIVDEELMQYTCGLLPIGEACVVTTTGLKWNLDNELLQFGVLVSTSNTYTDTKVIIETDKPLIWTMEIKLES